MNQDGVAIPEHLPGEPQRVRLASSAFAARLLFRAVATVLVAMLTAILWPIYWIAVAVWGWPPNVPRLRQVLRYLRLTWTVRPPPPGLPVLVRGWITLTILRKVALTPLWGLAWLLDEALYGAYLRDTPVVAPLIEISAGRSGSTQLARYLEEDPSLVAPSLLQSIFPYLWLWRLAPRTIGRFVTPDQVRQKMESMLPPEFLQRHEGDPFRTDTFDIVLFGSHLNHLSLFLGPEVAVEDFSFGSLAPHNRELWERDFVDALDRIARKTLLHAGPGPDGGIRRFFVKGHFLCAADALERRYPDARFLTMIREPAPRLQSAINYLRVNPTDAAGPVPWGWLSATLARTESDYCEIEQAWFSRQGGAIRCVIRFSEYVRDLETAMMKVYRECLDCVSVPTHVPKNHPPRQRTNYLVNRSLTQLGIDEAVLNAGLSSYVAWCTGSSSES